MIPDEQPVISAAVEGVCTSDASFSKESAWFRFIPPCVEGWCNSVVSERVELDSVSSLCRVDYVSVKKIK